MYSIFFKIGAQLPFFSAQEVHHILSLADKTTMSGTCLMKECMRASQMEDVDLKDINVAVVEESARTINGIVPPSTSMEAPIEQVSTKQPISKLKGLPASSGPLKMSSESIDDRRPSMSLPQQQNGCLPGVNEVRCMVIYHSISVIVAVCSFSSSPSFSLLFRSTIQV
jgi:hypothetical protein